MGVAYLGRLAGLVRFGIFGIFGFFRLFGFFGFFGLVFAELGEQISAQRHDGDSAHRLLQSNRNKSVRIESWHETTSTTRQSMENGGDTETTNPPTPTHTHTHTHTPTHTHTHNPQL